MQGAVQHSLLGEGGGWHYELNYDHNTLVAGVVSTSPTFKNASSSIYIFSEILFHIEQFILIKNMVLQKPTVRKINRMSIFLQRIPENMRIGNFFLSFLSLY